MNNIHRRSKVFFETDVNIFLLPSDNEKYRKSELRFYKKMRKDNTRLETTCPDWENDELFKGFFETIFKTNNYLFVIDKETNVSYIATFIHTLGKVENNLLKNNLKILKKSITTTDTLFFNDKVKYGSLIATDTYCLWGGDHEFIQVMYEYWLSLDTSRKKYKLFNRDKQFLNTEFYTNIEDFLFNIGEDYGFRFYDSFTEIKPEMWLDVFGVTSLYEFKNMKVETFTLDRHLYINEINVSHFKKLKTIKYS